MKKFFNYSIACTLLLFTILNIFAQEPDVSRIAELKNNVYKKVKAFIQCIQSRKNCTKETYAAAASAIIGLTSLVIGTTAGIVFVVKKARESEETEIPLEHKRKPKFQNPQSTETVEFGEFQGAEPVVDPIEWGPFQGADVPTHTRPYTALPTQAVIFGNDPLSQ